MDGNGIFSLSSISPPPILQQAHNFHKFYGFFYLFLFIFFITFKKLIHLLNMHFPMLYFPATFQETSSLTVFYLFTLPFLHLFFHFYFASNFYSFQSNFNFYLFILRLMILFIKPIDSLYSLFLSSISY